MDPIDRPAWLGLLSPTSRTGLGLPGSLAVRSRSKRNLWVVIGFFGLILASLIGSQL